MQSSTSTFYNKSSTLLSCYGSNNKSIANYFDHMSLQEAIKYPLTPLRFKIRRITTNFCYSLENLIITIDFLEYSVGRLK